MNNSIFTRKSVMLHFPTSKLLKFLIVTVFFGLFLISSETYSQTYIQWSNSGNNITGTFPGGTVTVSQSTGGHTVTLGTPAAFPDNVVVTGNKTFDTFGPTTYPPSNQLVFTFSTPVIVTRYNMSDIDLGSSWNDTFSFVGITFTSTTSVNCSSTTTGVTANDEEGNSAEYASWFTSTTPVSSFSLNYANTGGLTHAYLAYSVEVMLPSQNTVSINSPTICETETATITATPAVSGNYNYVWTVPSGATNPGNVATFTTSIGGVYSVLATNTANNEISSGSGTVTVTPKVTPLFTQVNPICVGQNLSPLPTLSLNSIAGSWSPNLNNSQTTTYTFTPNSGTCANTTQMTIEVNPKITPTFAAETILCYGENYALPLISLENISGSWSPQYNSFQSSNYTFTPNAGECALPTSLYIEVQNDFDYQIVSSCQDGDFILTVEPLASSFDISNASVEWEYNTSIVNSLTSFNVTSLFNSITTPIALPLTFEVTVTISNGCSKTKSISIDSIYCDIPKGVSSNNDNLNDYFDLTLLNVKHLTIYNRYGTKVYAKENYSNEWKGQTDNDVLLPDGTYYYVIEFNDENQGVKTGWVYLITEK